MNIITLDIDDCVFPSDIMYFGRTDDSLKVLEINLKRLVMILDKYNMKIFITSSWYSSLTLKDDNIDYKFRNYAGDKKYYAVEYQAFLLLEKYLNGYVVGLSCGNRFDDIKDLVQNGHKVIAYDDMDLSELDTLPNFLWVKITGFIDGLAGYKTHLFMTENKIYKGNNE